MSFTQHIFKSFDFSNYIQVGEIFLIKDWNDIHMGNHDFYESLTCGLQGGWFFMANKNGYTDMRNRGPSGGLELCFLCIEYKANEKKFDNTEYCKLLFRDQFAYYFHKQADKNSEMKIWKSY